MDSSASETSLTEVVEPEWTMECTEQLISTHGPRIVDAVTASGRPLIFDAIARRQSSSVRRIFSYAKKLDIPINLTWGEDDILRQAIEESERATKSVVEYLLDRCSTVEDTSRVLSSNLPGLVHKHPKLISEYLTADRLSFEYGRFFVPVSLFRDADGQPIAMMADEEPSGWEATSSETAKAFWTRNCPKHIREALEDTTGPQMTAVAKFVCIDQRFTRLTREGAVFGINADVVSMRCSRTNFLTLLATADLPVEIFNSESLKSLVEWRFHSLRRRFWFVCLWYVSKAVIFSVFAADYGRLWRASMLLRRMYQVTLFVVAALPLWTTFRSRLHVVSALTLVPLTFYVIMDRRYQISFFLTSVHCVVSWLLVVQCLRPLDRVGPFISMVRYSLFDTLPFIFLGTLVLFGFSLAFTILSNHGSVNSDGSKCEEDGESVSGSKCEEEGEFASVPNAFQTLFYACLGNIEGEVFQFKGGFLSITRSILFDAFVFVGGIVLLSLLVAILSDTYDRVKLKEKAELTKCRALMAGWLAFTRSIGTCSKKSGFWLSKWHLLRGRVFHTFRFLNPPVPPASNGKYFHYLVPEEAPSDDEDDQWQGRVLAINRSLRKESKKHEEQLAEQTRTVLHQFSEFKEQCDERFAAIQANIDLTHRRSLLEDSNFADPSVADRMSAVEDRMGRLEDKLDRVLQRLEPSESSRASSLCR